MGIAKTMCLRVDAIPTIVKPNKHINSYEMESFHLTHPAAVKRRQKQASNKKISN